MKTEEGKITVDGYQIWYRCVGNSGIPLLTLHGGPGAGHDYLEPLEMLGRSVIFYDQLGCGKSDHSDKQSLWRIERFVTEIDMVRRELGLTHIHLLGQSYGGWLAIEYLLSNPLGVVSSILASTSASVSQYVTEMRRLKTALPHKIYQTLQRYEATEDFHHPDYEAAYSEFLKRHMCRLTPWPDSLIRTATNVKGFAGYKTMWGPNEFEPIGTLKDWDRTSRLGEITVPTLITVGRYDEITPACAKTLYRGIPGSQMVIFEESAHVAHLEETDRYIEVIADFLRNVELSSSLQR
jgi:proline-specific peptidase